MNFFLLFVQILFYTLGVPVICGLVVGLLDYFFNFLMGRGVGRGMIMVSSIIGTPIHELGHALMCIIFGHKIDQMVLWQPFSPDGTLGYVSHRYNPKNIYHQLGNIFIGLGPIFSGLGIILLCMLLAFPQTLSTYAQQATALVSADGGILSLLEAGWGLFTGIFTEWGDGAKPVWGRILAVVVMLCVSLHISLSPADIKGALGGVPVFLGIALIATIIISICGQNAMLATSSALAFFAAAAFALFMPVFIFAAFWLALGLSVRLIRRLFHLR